MHDCVSQIPTLRPPLAFSHLNLRRNPFGDPSLEERAQLAVLDELDQWAQFVRTPKSVIQFIGDKGRGKTTRLLALHRQFPDATYLRIGPGERPAIQPSDPLFIDELQNYPRRLRKRLFNCQHSFAIGTHIDHTREYRRAGLRVLTIEPALAVSQELLTRAFAKRIEWARRAAGQVPQLKADTIAALCYKHGTDIRAMENELYHVFQTLMELRDV
jgi:hypothetical protein